jgi:uncharacterized membrane protein YphA (DoxX/SURF4 family)
MTFLTTVFWVLIAAFIVPFFYFGYKKLTGDKAMIDKFLGFGYTQKFMLLTGINEIIAGIFVLFPQTRWIGLSMFGANMIGAFYTIINKKVHKEELTPASMVTVHLLIIVVFVFWGYPK